MGHKSWHFNKILSLRETNEWVDPVHKMIHWMIHSQIGLNDLVAAVPPFWFHIKTLKRFYKLWQTEFHGCCFLPSRMEMAILTSRSWMLSWRTSMRRTIRWDKKAQNYSSIGQWQIRKAIPQTVTVFNLRRWTLRAWMVISKASWHCQTGENCTAQSWRLSFAGSPCCESRLPDLNLSSVPAAWIL